MSTNGFSKARRGRLHDVLSSHVERGRLPGLVTVVYRRGEVLVDAIGMHMTGGADAAGNQPMRRDTIFRIASMTKPIIAVATMILVEECKLRLDDAVDALLPELANRQVLKRLDGPLDETVPAERALTVRDLLTFRLGYGLVLAPSPLQQAVAKAGLAPGPTPPAFTPDEFLQRLGTLPLAHQPGERWMYHTGSDVLGVLIARASGQPLEEFLRQRIFLPLAMPDTGFHVPPDKISRLPPTYMTDPQTGTLAMHDDPRASRWASAPSFASGGGGLVSTADDYLAFCRMLLNKGTLGGERILSRTAVELMTTDHLTPAQRSAAGMFLGASRGWGFGMSVCTRRDNLWDSPGRFGWDGGMGTSGYSDPAEDLAGILMTQRLMDSPSPPQAFQDFWTCVYQAIDG